MLTRMFRAPEGDAPPSGAPPAPVSAPPAASVPAPPPTAQELHERVCKLEGRRVPDAHAVLTVARQSPGGNDHDVLDDMLSGS